MAFIGLAEASQFSCEILLQNGLGVLYYGLLIPLMKAVKLRIAWVFLRYSGVLGERINQIA